MCIEVRFLEFKQKVLESLSKSDVTQDLEYDGYIGKVKEQKSEELIQELITITPDEVGGRIALTGFYYQFLVFLDYWTQMIKGEWDFAALELHEDIVVGKGKKLRFIQVKSSKETEKYASETIYQRTKVKVNKKVTGEINNSWIDKLINKAKYFRKSEGFETEFELVTSFVILDSTKGMQIKKYRTETFPEDVQEDDYLVKFLKNEKLQDKEENIICYEQDSGEQISELLSRFHIIKRSDLDTIRIYENHILMVLSEVLGEGAKLTQEDLMMLVGRLMKMCNLYEEKLMLYISRTESDELLQILDDKATKRAENRAQNRGSTTIIDEVFSNLSQQLSNMDLYQDVNMYVLAYKKYLAEWINGGGTIRELINRYLDGDQYSSIYNLEHIDQQKQRLFDFFAANLLLIVAYNDISKFSVQYKTMLVKEIQHKFIGFLSMNRGDRIEKGIEKAKSLLKNYEDIQLLINPPKTILQGKFINNKANPLKVELINKEIEIDELPDELKLDDVNIILHIIPGGVFEAEFDNLFSFNDIDELKDHLASLWGGLLEN
jgi:hypothetical protein